MFRSEKKAHRVPELKDGRARDCSKSQSLNREESTRFILSPRAYIGERAPSSIESRKLPASSIINDTSLCKWVSEELMNARTNVSLSSAQPVQAVVEISYSHCGSERLNS